MKVTGANIIGGNPKNGRVTDDWYATSPEAVEKLLSIHEFKGQYILEPCVGMGHIADVLEWFFGSNVTAIDIVDRGYPNVIIEDFLKWKPDKKYDTIITNPPYCLASEFIFKCMDLLCAGGQLAMFLKIQFLEGQKRKALFSKYPPKYVYVFRARVPVFNSGMAYNPETGKKWQTLMCFAWYVWEWGFCGEPVIRWID